MLSGFLSRVSLAAMCCLCAELALATDWPQPAFDAGHSAASPEILPTQLGVQWTIDLPRLKPAWPDQKRLNFDDCYRPLIVGGRVIVASSRDDTVAAYDLNDGHECWRFFAGGPLRLPPASDGTRVFAGADDGWFYALSADRGELLWKFKGAPQSRPILGNGRLIDTWCVRGGPVVADGQVYFAAGIWPFMGVFIHCLDAATGKPVWSNSGEGAEFMVQPHGAKSFGGIAPQGTLTVSGQHVLVPGGRSLPACFDRRTGQRQYFLLATKTGDHAVAANDRLFFCAGTAYDLTDGRAVGAVPDNPVLDGGKLYAWARGTVVAADLDSLSAAGAKAASAKVTASTPFPAGAVLIKAGDRLYAGGQASLAAFDLPLRAGQSPAWRLGVEGNIGALAAGHGRLIAVTEQGRIYCLSDNPAKESGVHVDRSLRDRVSRLGETRPRELAETVVRDAGVGAGYALVLGAGNGELPCTLAARSSLHVVVLEPDAAKAQALRKTLYSLGLYGERVAVWIGNLESTKLPPYFADLVLAENAADLSADLAWPGRLFSVLHPYHGKAYLQLTGPQRQALDRFAAGDTPGKATVGEAVGLVRLTRSGGLPGTGSWTHEHADAANTRVSTDTLVKAPLGLLWFGGSSHDSILPRHGHGPMPQVLDGRLVIEQVDGLRSVDIYTGRILWEAPVAGLGSYYNNTSHQYGANGTGTNYISTPDAIYVRYLRECLRLDPATGLPLPSIPLPAVAAGGETIWGYLNVVNDYLLGGLATPDKSIGSLKWLSIPLRRTAAAAVKEVPQAIESQSLFVLDRHSGKLVWSAVALGRFRHNAVCAGGGRLYAIDQPSAATAEAGAPPSSPARLVAFDLATGQVVWSKNQGVFGTWLSYSAPRDVLIESGNGERDARKDEPRGMRAWRASDGKQLWHDPRASGPPMIRGDWVLRSQGGCGLLDGQPLQIDDPLTDAPRVWKWTRAYGCNTPAASEHLLVFRSGAAGFYDLARFGGTGNWGGFRSSCTNNLIVAGGLITSPDYTRTCTCSYQNQTSLALVPDPEVELWTYQGYAVEGRQPIRRLGVNFGAPGNRVDDHGTLWLEYPRVTDASAKSGSPGLWPQIQVTASAPPATFFRQHSSTVTGPLPWVCASGMQGVQSLRVALTGHLVQPQRYTVRLYFAEPEDLQPGGRPFSVALQDREVLSNFDVAREAGGPRRGLVKSFDGIRIDEALVVTLTPRGSRPAILCGLELIADGAGARHLALPDKLPYKGSSRLGPPTR
ncbi:MAG: PQQ-binding-like beta-propeller repeat protein [Planctomycetota bacterium]|nr:PQQ-binding-like beta-propeller repeat protein [Planctomycetota bacterium]